MNDACDLQDTLVWLAVSCQDTPGALLRQSACAISTDCAQAQSYVCDWCVPNMLLCCLWPAATISLQAANWWCNYKADLL